MDIEYVKRNAEYTGECGEGLSWWQLGGDLYIEGQGKVTESAFVCRENIQNVVIAPGCTGIGAYAFQGCDLKNVQLPDGLRIIGEHAFDVYNPDEYSELTLEVPDSVTRIGRDAFSWANEVIYNGPAIPENENYNWGACKWNWNAVLHPTTLALHCPCGRLNNTKLTTTHPESFDGAKLAAHSWYACQFPQILVQGEEIEVSVMSPFCCEVGEVFWATNRQDNLEGKRQYRYTQAKLLSIVKKDDLKATIRVRILQTIDRMAYVKQVSEEVKKQLKEQHIYRFRSPEPIPQILKEDKDITIYYYSVQGDLEWHIYVYTDPDGIDHLILNEYENFEGGYSFVGDEILGYHDDHPFRWENGLLIDWDSKSVIACQEDATEVIVPEGIVFLDHNSFWNCSKLERIYIPNSLELWSNAFDQLDSLKEIVVTDVSDYEDGDFPEWVSVVGIH